MRFCSKIGASLADDHGNSQRAEIVGILLSDFAKVFSGSSGANTRDFSPFPAEKTYAHLLRVSSEASGRGETSPVGSFSPRGDSPYHAADMVGNTFEYVVVNTKSIPTMQKMDVRI